MKVHKWKDLRRSSPARVAEMREQLESEVLEMNLAAVRELAGKTQTEMAEVLGVAQAQISQAEHREDHLVSTLRAYVGALGGELEVVARFGDKSVRMKGV